MSHGIDEIIRKINSKTDIPDLSPGGIVQGQPLPHGCKDADMVEVVEPLEKLKRILKESYQAKL